MAVFTTNTAKQTLHVNNIGRTYVYFYWKCRSRLAYISIGVATEIKKGFFNTKSAHAKTITHSAKDNTAAAKPHQLYLGLGVCVCACYHLLRLTFCRC